MFNLLTSVISNSNPTFRFLVNVNGAPYGVFTECDLPTVEWDVKEVTEGGLNTYIHQLPGRRKLTKCTLKSGVGTNLMISWYIATMEQKFNLAPGMGLRRTVTIVLLNSLKLPVMTWNISKAFPVKWTGPQLKTSENSIAIQTLELAGGEITIIPGMG
jgi:phage tail-like protein